MAGAMRFSTNALADLASRIASAADRALALELEAFARVREACVAEGERLRGFGAAVAEIDVARVEELPPGTVKIVHAGEISVGVYNLGGRYCAIEDRCSHDDGPLAEGELDAAACTVECPRHGSRFDLKTGKPLTLPAYAPVDTFPVVVHDDVIKLDVD